MNRAAGFGSQQIEPHRIGYSCYSVINVPRSHRMICGLSCPWKDRDRNMKQKNQEPRVPVQSFGSRWSAAANRYVRNGCVLIAVFCIATLARAELPTHAKQNSDPTQYPATIIETTPGVSMEAWRMVETADTVALTPASFLGLPGLDRPEARALWEKGFAQEAAGQLLSACETYQQLSQTLPDSSSAAWRISRSYWRHAESLPPEEKESRIEYFLLAEEAATRGMEVDDRCAECMLWRYASLGRLATTRGVVTAARDVSTMAKLLEHAIALNPQHRDAEFNSTLGNLYYASATFYRMVPDWFWIKWVIGVRGDKERGLRDARKAVELAEVRVDYQIELGASLLCLGARREEPEQIAEGEAVLRKAIELPHVLPTDGIDQEYARILLQRPGQACAFSRDGFIDVEAAGRQL